MPGLSLANRSVNKTPFKTSRSEDGDFTNSSLIFLRVAHLEVINGYFCLVEGCGERVS